MSNDCIAWPRLCLIFGLMAVNSLNLVGQSDRMSISKRNLDLTNADIYCAGLANIWNGEYSIQVPKPENIEKILAEVYYEVEDNNQHIPTDKLVLSSGDQTVQVTLPKREFDKFAKKHYFVYRAQLFSENGQIQLKGSNQNVPVCYKLIVFRGQTYQEKLTIN